MEFIATGEACGQGWCVRLDRSCVQISMNAKMHWIVKGEQASRDIAASAQELRRWRGCSFPQSLIFAAVCYLQLALEIDDFQSLCWS